MSDLITAHLLWLASNRFLSDPQEHLVTFGIFPPAAPVSPPNLCVAGGSGPLAGDPLRRLPFQSKASAGVESPPTHPAVFLFSLTVSLFYRWRN
jgi:hypothetical protein